MSDKIDLSLSPPRLQVAPGETVATTATIKNAGDVVEAYSIMVEGIDRQWCTLSKTSLQLFPADHEQVQISIQPPRTSAAKAGPYDVVVRVATTSPERPTDETTAPLALEVKPFLQFDLNLSPRRARGRKGSYRLRITNSGNEATDYTLVGEDPEEMCGFDFKRQVVRVEHGTTAEVPVVVDPKKKPFTGRAQAHRFKITVTPHAEGAEAKSVDGELECTPFLIRGALSLPGMALGWLRARAHRGLKEEGKTRCPVCGFDGPPDMRFCTNCGTDLQAAAPRPTSASLCPQCGSEVSPQAKFCGQCGATLANVCPGCGSEFTPGTRFCGQCGQDLTREALAVAPRVAPRVKRALPLVTIAAGIGAILMLISLAVPWYIWRDLWGPVQSDLTASFLINPPECSGSECPNWVGRGFPIVLVIVCASIALISVAYCLFRKGATKRLWIGLGALSALCVAGNAIYMFLFVRDFVDVELNIAAGSILALIGALVLLFSGVIRRRAT